MFQNTKLLKDGESFSKALLSKIYVDNVIQADDDITAVKELTEFSTRALVLDCWF